mgnify:CR=1 FL=1
MHVVPMDAGGTPPELSGGDASTGGDFAALMTGLMSGDTQIVPLLDLPIGDQPPPESADGGTAAEDTASLLEFIGNSVIVGHNVRFDMSFLNAAAIRLGYGRIPNPTSDTLGLARRLVRREVARLNLQSLAAHFRSPVKPTHRAFADAEATAHVFWSLLERAGTIGVTHLDDLLRLPTARGAPHYSKIGLTERLPRSPGVYLFRDRDGEVIYVGKAKNLRTRVRSYFYGDDRRSVAQMLRDLVAVDHRVCATELEASITEVRLIHAHAPRYNRRSRPPRSTHWVKLTDEDFPRLSVVRTLRPDGFLYLGPFRTRRAANTVVAAIWDAVPIRRCMTRGGKRSPACSFAQLGVALCPCDGAVSGETYARVVRRLRRGIEDQPGELLDPLVSRLRDYARTARFEEAAELRDRHHSLARALADRRHWDTLRRAGEADAVLLGAMGMPDIRYPDGTEISPQLDLRERLDLFAGVRPVKALPGLPASLADPRASGPKLWIMVACMPPLTAQAWPMM